MSAAFQCDLCGKFSVGQPIQKVSSWWVFRHSTLPRRMVTIQLTGDPAPDLCANCFKAVCVDSIDNKTKETA